MPATHARRWQEAGFPNQWEPSLVSTGAGKGKLARLASLTLCGWLGDQHVLFHGRVFSSTTVQKYQFFGAQLSL